MKLKTLKKRSDFLLLRDRGQSWVSRGLVLQVLPNNLDEIRVGFTVSKKVSSKAVLRNRAQRRLREVAWEVLPDCAKLSCDYVLIGRTLTLARSYETLCQDLKWCLEKMDKLNTNQLESL